jgi:hypothetical protein
MVIVSQYVKTDGFLWIRILVYFTMAAFCKLNFFSEKSVSKCKLFGWWQMTCILFSLKEVSLPCNVQQCLTEDQIQCFQDLDRQYSWETQVQWKPIRLANWTLSEMKQIQTEEYWKLKKNLKYWQMFTFIHSS